MPQRRALPPFLGIPQLLDAIGQLTQNEQDVEEMQRRKADILNPAATEDWRMKLLSILGFAPKPDETLASFWGRQAPRTLPPSAKELDIGDIQIPSETKPVRRKLKGQ